MTRGFFEIGIINGKTAINLGTLWRSAYQLGASGLFTIGRRYEPQSSDTYNTIKHIPLRNYEDFDDFMAHRPYSAPLVSIEMGGVPLASFRHPQQVIYLLGAEDNGIPARVLNDSQWVVSIEAVRRPSFNVAVAGSIVMYSRLLQEAAK